MTFHHHHHRHLGYHLERAISSFIVWNMNRDMVFDAHIHVEVEEKVMPNSKLCLLDKQHDREILNAKKPNCLLSS